MRRRTFIAGLGSATAWPLVARGQQGDARRIGVLMGRDEHDPVVKTIISAFTQALAELGWTDGRNVRMDLRWGGDINRIRALAQELVGQQPDIIVTNSTVDRFRRRAVKGDALVMGKYRPTVDRCRSPVVEYGKSVGKRPAHGRGDRAGGTHRQRPDVLSPGRECQRPFLPKHRELLTCFLGAPSSLNLIWKSRPSTASKRDYTALEMSMFGVALLPCVAFRGGGRQ